MLDPLRYPGLAVAVHPALQVGHEASMAEIPVEVIFSAGCSCLDKK